MPDTSVVEITEKDISASSGDSHRRLRASRRRSFWRDPVAMTLIFGIALAIIGALLVAVFAVLNGSISLGSAPPATLDQALLQRAKGTVKTDKTAESYTALIFSQVDAGDSAGAQVTLAEAKRQKFDLTRTQMIDYCQAYIYQNNRRQADAIKLYNQVMSKLMKAYEDEKAKGGDMNWALAYGLPDNYYNSASLLADIYAGAKDYNNVVKYLTIYLGQKGAPNATVFIDRGNAYLALGQKDKAKQDFQNALKYIPGDAAATAGLKKAEGK
ncbi:MAG: tetratricopeptide repeat protein [Actinomycetia bacterium]|nr:tetratricopeptide repeat protein [Actinomycetes bacterium]